jgi:hypothetical protein
MADVFEGPLVRRANPGERWRLGDCGCEGVVAEGMMRDDNGGWVYLLVGGEADNAPDGCGGDWTRGHWGLNPDDPGARALPEGTP